MKITSKGQVTIPREIRERHIFLPHTEVEFLEDGDKVFLVKTKGRNDSNSAFDKVQGTSTTGLSTEEIMKLTRGDE